jgi:hypothetical protein
MIVHLYPQHAPIGVQILETLVTVNAAPILLFVVLCQI